MDLLSISDLTSGDIQAIWSLASGPDRPLQGCAAWSFEGNGIRTRTTFVQAFRDLGMQFTELPNLLKTPERVEDLAGYLDPFFALYVIRESNHDRLQAFAAASSRPVVNAMSALGHPCEVLADAYFVDRSVKPLADARVCLWGPTTNVFRSWHDLARVVGVRLVQVCAEQHHEPDAPVEFTSLPPRHADVVITDAWANQGDPGAVGLAEDHLVAMGSPVLLPTPPFEIGRELLFDPASYPRFAGYRQKALLLPVQKAILRHVTATPDPGR
jgi:ornithine carbamoyltransferase